MTTKPTKIKANQKRYECFTETFEYWAERLLHKEYPIRHDNRFNGHCVADYDYESKKTIIRYNVRKIAKWDFPMLVSGVFHEIGHIKQGDLPYETKLEKIQLEHDAESFSIKMLKKYYPSLLPEVIYKTKKAMSRSKWRWDFPIHFIAFVQIPEYSI